MNMLAVTGAISVYLHTVKKEEAGLGLGLALRLRLL